MRRAFWYPLSAASSVPFVLARDAAEQPLGVGCAARQFLGCGLDRGCSLLKRSLAGATYAKQPRAAFLVCHTGKQPIDVSDTGPTHRCLGLEVAATQPGCPALGALPYFFLVLSRHGTNPMLLPYDTNACPAMFATSAGPTPLQLELPQLSGTPNRFGDRTIPSDEVHLCLT